MSTQKPRLLTQYTCHACGVPNLVCIFCFRSYNGLNELQYHLVYEHPGGITSEYFDACKNGERARVVPQQESGPTVRGDVDTSSRGDCLLSEGIARSSSPVDSVILPTTSVQLKDTVEHATSNIVDGVDATSSSLEHDSNNNSSSPLVVEFSDVELPSPVATASFTDVALSPIKGLYLQTSPVINPTAMSHELVSQSSTLQDVSDIEELEVSTETGINTPTVVTPASSEQQTDTTTAQPSSRPVSASVSEVDNSLEKSIAELVSGTSLGYEVCKRNPALARLFLNGSIIPSPISMRTRNRNRQVGVVKPRAWSSMRSLTRSPSTVRTRVGSVPSTPSSAQIVKRRRGRPCKMSSTATSSQSSQVVSEQDATVPSDSISTADGLSGVLSDSADNTRTSDSNILNSSKEDFGDFNDTVTGTFKTPPMGLASLLTHDNFSEKDPSFISPSSPFDINDDLRSIATIVDFFVNADDAGTISDTDTTTEASPSPALGQSLCRKRKMASLCAQRSGCALSLESEQVPVIPSGVSSETDVASKPSEKTAKIASSAVTIESASSSGSSLETVAPSVPIPLCDEKKMTSSSLSSRECLPAVSRSAALLVEKSAHALHVKRSPSCGELSAMSETPVGPATNGADTTRSPYARVNPLKMAGDSDSTAILIEDEHCLNCQKTFSSPTQLQGHIMFVQGGVLSRTKRPCMLCCRHSLTRDQLAKHLKTLHYLSDDDVSRCIKSVPASPTKKTVLPKPVPVKTIPVCCISTDSNRVYSKAPIISRPGNSHIMEVSPIMTHLTPPYENVSMTNVSLANTPPPSKRAKGKAVRCSIVLPTRCTTTPTGSPQAVSTNHPLSGNGHSHRFTCERCKEQFGTRPDLEIHVKRRELMSCEECSLVFCRSFNYKVHLDGHEAARSGTPAPTFSGPIECVTCRRTFPNKESFSDHLTSANQSAVLSYACIHCCAAFSGMFEWVRHSTIHSDASTVHACTRCAFVASSRRALLKHSLAVHKLDQHVVNKLGVM